MNQSLQGSISKPRPNRSRKWLVIVLVVIILAAAAFLIYRKYSSAAPLTSPSPSPIATKSPSPMPTVTVSSNPTGNWKTYNDIKYSLTFKYPDSWPEPQLTSYNQPDPLSFVQIANDYLDYNPNDSGKYYFQTVEISLLADYKSSQGSAYNKLLNVYNNKTATGADKIWMPPSNAAIIAAGPPVYIENNDGSYRGIYYFGTIGQALSTNIDLVAILTNGKNVFQLHIALKSDQSAQYESTLLSNPEKFQKYVEGLTTSSDETIVKEFNSIYQYIIKSVK